MSSDATDNPAVELQALRWDGQDVPARRATLTDLPAGAAWAEVKKTRGALGGDSEADQVSGWQP